MKALYIPYTGTRPASIVVNGHKLLILSQDKDTLEESLDLIGADSVRKIRNSESDAEQELAIDRIARKNRASIVIAPIEAEVSDILRSLETELPWLQ